MIKNTKPVPFYPSKKFNFFLPFLLHSLRFCVGDRFYLCENKILCEYDYEERLVFASIGNHPMLKRHANNVSQNQSQSSSFSKGNGISTHGMMAIEAQKSHDDHNNNNNSHGHPPGCGPMYGVSHLKIQHNN